MFCGNYSENHKEGKELYREITLECGYRFDILIENSVVVEFIVAESINPVHQTQKLT